MTCMTLAQLLAAPSGVPPPEARASVRCQLTAGAQRALHSTLRPRHFGAFNIAVVLQTGYRCSHAFSIAAYNRDTLLFMRNSPHARTPPAGMHAIPGITVGVAPKPESNGSKPQPTAAAAAPKPKDDDALFEMDT